VTHSPVGSRALAWAPVADYYPQSVVHIQRYSIILECIQIFPNCITSYSWKLSGVGFSFGNRNYVIQAKFYMKYWVLYVRISPVKIGYRLGKWNLFRVRVRWGFMWNSRLLSWNVILFLHHWLCKSKRSSVPVRRSSDPTRSRWSSPTSGEIGGLRLLFGEANGLNNVSGGSSAPDSL